MTARENNPRHEHYGRDALLWFIALAPPVLWSLHLLLAYWISNGGGIWSDATVRGVLIGVTALLAVIVLIAFVLGFRRWRERPASE